MIDPENQRRTARTDALHCFPFFSSNVCFSDMMEGLANRALGDEVLEELNVGLALETG